MRRPHPRSAWTVPLATAAALFFSAPARAASPGPVPATRALLARLLPAQAGKFVLETIPAPPGADVFEIESRNNQVVLRGNNGIAMASALNWYLKYYCHRHISLWGDNLRLPSPLPAVKEKVRHSSPFRYRYYLNFCSFSYSTAWWDWPQWERLIDWMALHGINMPLSVTGQEAIWYKVYRDLGLTDHQVREFFVGPGFLPFGWMGCMDGWGGPLPKSWIDGHLDLEKKIAARERSLGMTPVLQGFTGHVPAALRQALPSLKLQTLPPWNGFPPTYFLDPQDPLFIRLGKLFIEEQTRQFGTDHLYASDTFIEMTPPSNDPRFLSAMGKGVYQAMRAADPQAIWVMQGWIFVNSPDFWKPPQGRALLGAVPNDRMILLDLACENMPAWNKTEAFYGKPWIWNVIQDYGDVVSLHAGLPQIAANLREALTSPRRGALEGIGIVNEGLGTNPVVNDFLGEMSWRAELPDLAQWLQGHIEGRYGRRPPAAQAAWDTLLRTAYRCPGGHFSPVVRRPSLTTAKQSRPAYHVAELAPAWPRMLDCANQLASSDPYRFDLVHIAREVLADLAFTLRQDAITAYEKKDRAALAQARERYLQLIRDMDELLATRPEFLLGRWLSDARRWGASADERRLAEWNARTIITLWGARDSTLHEYANRQWSGLLADFYLPRWRMFFDRLDASLAAGTPFDAAAFERAAQVWEERWTHETRLYPTAPRGDSVAVARRLWAKYQPYLGSR